METRNCSLARSSGEGPFLLVCTYDDFPNDISSCSSTLMPFLVYAATGFVGEERGTTPVWKVLYVGINPGGNIAS